jgi:hypothetical protein
MPAPVRLFSKEGTSFSESEVLTDGSRPPVWFAFNERRQMAFFALRRLHNFWARCGRRRESCDSSVPGALTGVDDVSGIAVQAIRVIRVSFNVALPRNTGSPAHIDYLLADVAFVGKDRPPRVIYRTHRTRTLQALALGGEGSAPRATAPSHRSVVSRLSADFRSSLS